jgi:hypothetical protein
VDEPTPREDQYTALFAAGEAAVAAGQEPQARPVAPPELLSRLERDLACARMIELAEAIADRVAAHMTALTCVLEANTVPKWDAVLRLASRAAEGYEGDSRIHVAALFRAGQFDEALRRASTTDLRYGFIVWESLFRGMVRHKAGRHEEARSNLEQKFKMIDFLDKEYPRDPKSKVWSDWLYYVECHVLRKEATSMLGDTQ